MCAIFDAISTNADAIILRHGRDAKIVEMRYKNDYNLDREPTGREHVGFEFHFITVFYGGYVWNIEPSTFCPFTDVNNPGEIGATPYIFTGDNTIQQCGYTIPFEKLDDLEECRTAPLKGTCPRPVIQERNEFMKIYQAQASISAVCSLYSFNVNLSLVL